MQTNPTGDSAPKETDTFPLQQKAGSCTSQEPGINSLRRTKSAISAAWPACETAEDDPGCPDYPSFAACSREMSHSRTANQIAPGGMSRNTASKPLEDPKCQSDRKEGHAVDISAHPLRGPCCSSATGGSTLIGCQLQQPWNPAKYSGNTNSQACGVSDQGGGPSVHHNTWDGVGADEGGLGYGIKAVPLKRGVEIITGSDELEVVDAASVFQPGMAYATSSSQPATRLGGVCVAMASSTASACPVASSSQPATRLCEHSTASFCPVTSSSQLVGMSPAHPLTATTSSQYTEPAASTDSITISSGSSSPSALDISLSSCTASASHCHGNWPHLTLNSEPCGNLAMKYAQLQISHNTGSSSSNAASIYTTAASNINYVSSDNSTCPLRCGADDTVTKKGHRHCMTKLDSEQKLPQHHTHPKHNKEVNLDSDSPTFTDEDVNHSLGRDSSPSYTSGGSTPHGGMTSSDDEEPAPLFQRMMTTLGKTKPVTRDHQPVKPARASSRKECVTKDREMNGNGFGRSQGAKVGSAAPLRSTDGLNSEPSQYSHEVTHSIHGDLGLDRVSVNYSLSSGRRQLQGNSTGAIEGRGLLQDLSTSRAGPVFNRLAPRGASTRNVGGGRSGRLPVSKQGPMYVQLLEEYTRKSSSEPRQVLPLGEGGCFVAGQPPGHGRLLSDCSSGSHKETHTHQVCVFDKQSDINSPPIGSSADSPIILD